MSRTLSANDCLGGVWPRILSVDQAAPSWVWPSNDAGWIALFNAAQSHGLQGALVVRLQQLGLAEAFSDEVRAELLVARRASVIRALKVQAVLQLALDALAECGVIPVAYKGAALAFLRYPDPAMRPMCDIDLWVAEHEMPPAIEALARRGFVQRMDVADRPLALQASFEGEVQMRHPAHGLVELHWGVFPGEWLKRAAAIDRAAVRSRVVDGRLLGRPIRLLAPRDHLVQVALHATVSCRMSANALRNLLDVALIADEIDDWDGLLTDVVRWRVARAVGHALLLAGRLFDRPALLQAADRLDRRASLRPLLWQIDQDDVLARRFAWVGWRRWSYLFAATDRWRDALGLTLHALWPDRQWLADRYGHAGVLDRLRHAAHAVRGDV